MVHACLLSLSDQVARVRGVPVSMGVGLSMVGRCHSLKSDISPEASHCKLAVLKPLQHVVTLDDTPS